MSNEFKLNIDHLTKQQLRLLTLSLYSVCEANFFLFNECLEADLFSGNDELAQLMLRVDRANSLHTAFCAGLDAGLVKTGSRSK